MLARYIFPCPLSSKGLCSKKCRLKDLMQTAEIIVICQIVTQQRRTLQMPDEVLFPDIIIGLPQAGIPIQGLHAYLLQGSNHQVIFMSFESDVEVPEHSHEAQWGVVLDGEIELTINGNMQTYTKGDTYFIPKDVPHSARIGAGYKDLTLFNQKDRYKPKVNCQKSI